MGKNNLLVLATLLHGIGTFAERSGIRLQSSSQSTAAHTKNFIEKELPLPAELEQFRPRLAILASASNVPVAGNAQDFEAICMNVADHLATENANTNAPAVQSHLPSIFSLVHLVNNTPVQPRFYKLRELDAHNEAPVIPVPAGDAAATSCKELYQSFLRALRNIPLDKETPVYLQSLQTVLENFTWCLPRPDNVSLYDHGVVAAAIAQALAVATEDARKQNVGSMVSKKLFDAPLLLFSGELSGIQRFIFGSAGETQKGVGKLLRARSFSVQMLTRSIWRVLLDKCDLLPCARIMDAGGRFILLLPDTENIRTTIRTIEKNATEHVLQQYNGILRISFASQPLRATELAAPRFGEVYQQLTDKLEIEKLRPFAHLIKKGFPTIMDVDSSRYAKYGSCPFCGLRPARGENGDTAACPTCSTMIHQIGRRLPTARYAIFSRSEQGHDGFELFDGLHLRLEEKISDRDTDALDILNLKDREAFTAAPVAGYVPTIETKDRERWEKEGRRALLADKDNEAYAPKTFSVLAEEARVFTNPGFRSIAALATCKADVDNLGLIFGIGLKEHFSLARFAMLSRMLHHFFSSYLIERIKQDFPNIYVLFAGGDDLFVLGPWSDTINFSARMHELFAAFTGGNPDVTLSAGITLSKDDLPVRAIKDMAEEALETSKAFKDISGKTVKNAVTLFGVTCSWEDFPGILEKGKWFEEHCLDGNLSQGFVRRLLGYSRQAKNFRKAQPPDIAAGIYRSHMYYDMARNCGEDKIGDKTVRDKLYELRDNINFGDLQMGITWALYRTRTSQEKGGEK